MITWDFLDSEKAHLFQKPSMFHWLLAIEHAYATEKWPEEWRTHFDDHLPMARAFDLNTRQGGAFIQKAWLAKDAAVKPTALYFDFESPAA